MTHTASILDDPAAGYGDPRSVHDDSRSGHDDPAAAHDDPAAGDDDALFLLGERIADLAASINAAEGRMMTLLADFDRREGWKDEFSSCAEWLAWRVGIKIGSARERVRAARALENLPETAAELRGGRLSYAKVRAITRVATAENEGALLKLARAGSAARLEQQVRLWKQMSREGELAAEEVRHRNRTLSVFVDGDGMYVVKGRLEPEVGAMLKRAVEAASDALYRRESPDGARPTSESPKPRQRRADAVGLVAERALAAGFGENWEDDAGGTPGVRGHRPDESGTRAERYQVVVHTEAATLAEKGEPGRSDLDGVRVTAETSRRMACDAATVTMVHGKSAPGTNGLMSARSGVSGPVLSVGRRTRTIPPHIRRALEERDRGCRFPGCASRFTEAHHLKHWADGGETSLKNLLLLCRRHHRAVHEGRVKVGTSLDGVALFITRAGKVLADAPRGTRRNGRPEGGDRPGSKGRCDGTRRCDGAGRCDGTRGCDGAGRCDGKGRCDGTGGCDGTGACGDGEVAGQPVLPLPAAASAGALSNGAALYRDSAIPWAVEAAAMEAVEETM